MARIYGEGIATGNATFETELPSWESWKRSHLAAHRFVGLGGGRVLGWLAVTSACRRRVTGHWPTPHGALSPCLFPAVFGGRSSTATAEV